MKTAAGRGKNWHVLAGLLDHAEQMLVGVDLLVHELLLRQLDVLVLALGLRHKLLVVDKQLVPVALSQVSINTTHTRHKRHKARRT